MIFVWLISQAVVLSIILWNIAYEGLEMSRENAGVMALMVAFAPIALFALFCHYRHENMQDQKRRKCSQVMNSWNRAAQAIDQVGSRNWYSDKAREERLPLMRESIRSLTDKDLQLLAGVRKSTYEIEEPLRDAIVDELIERKILSSE